MRIGFIGTGTITEAVVKGLCTLDNPPDQVIVSPRNADRAARLCEMFNAVTVAPDNQSVVEASDMVCIAVRPDIAVQVLEELTFRKDQQVVSFLATIPIVQMRELVPPVSRIFRMVPLPPVANHLGPVALCPPDETIAQVFGGIGTITQVDTEAQLHALWTVTSMMGPYFGHLNQISHWLVDRGIDPHLVERYVGSMFHAIAVTGKQVGEGGFEELVVQHSTPNGLNEQALRELGNAGWCDATASVLDLIEARLDGKADFESRISSRLDLDIK